ncbi:MAG: aspartate/glutamate racemase family protein [Pseudomonadota bacterium]
MRIALIHAVRVAMDPVDEAFARLWPEARSVHLLDDSLSTDLARDGAITQAMTGRFVTLARYAHQTGADGILFTCSAFGPCIEAAAETVPIPVLKPNEAMFREGARAGTRVGLLASFAPSLPPMEAEFRAIAPSVALETACAPDAMVALNAGDGARHDQLLAQAAEALDGCDAIMLAQFSTARARKVVAEAVGLPVLTSPDSAVRAMRFSLLGGDGAP